MRVIKQKTVESAVSYRRWQTLVIKVGFTSLHVTRKWVGKLVVLLELTISARMDLNGRGGG